MKRIPISLAAATLVANFAVAPTFADAQTTDSTTQAPTRPGAAEPSNAAAPPGAAPAAPTATPSTTPGRMPDKATDTTPDSTPNAATGTGDQLKPSNNSSTTPPSATTSDANKKTSAAPVAGRNSFTEGEARRRIESGGFSNVTDLKQDDSGIWRGKAMKDSQQVSVYCDYQGNIGAQ